ncbi:MAG TPA: hypothetical protein VFW11_08575 [Cyclobacteriaceae bacterium]|nr:hypothetical protein [Cyclobacteriaceae bacterium]
MKEVQDYEKDLASIRSMMERSGKFLSLSGMSGIMAGVYALGGAAIAYFMIYYPYSPFGLRFYYVNEEEIIGRLLMIAITVLTLSLGTGFWLSHRKAKKLNTTIWNKTSQHLMINLLIPLITGGLFILILISRGYLIIVASACLIFYGLALTNAGRHTFEEVRYLGFCEILLGLAAALLPGYGLVFWSLGFGVLHIIYGTVMYYRYDK